MSSDDFRRDFSGVVPEPPVGTPTETAHEAWQMAYVARAVALRAEQKVAGIMDGQLSLFQEYGSLQANIARYFSQMNARFDDLEKRLDLRVTEASANAHEARTSSHDLADELQKMEVALKNVKERTVDSVKVKSMIDEQVETIVSKKRLAELETKEKEAVEGVKTRAAERRNFKILTYSGVIVAVVGVLAAYFVARATNPSAPAKIEAHP